MESSVLQRYIAEQHVPGLAAGIQQGSTLVFEQYAGYANYEHQLPVTRDTVFEIASITKLFTSQAVLRLVQDGKLELSQPLAIHLDHLPEAWQSVTIQHCLMHQSGIPGYTAAKSYGQLQRSKKSHQEILDLVRDKPLLFAPGTRYNYDNTGFYLLGMLIEAVTKQPYIDYLNEVIFKPAGMTHTQGNDYERIIPHRAQGYIRRDGTLYNKGFYDTSNTFSAGIMLSTLTDLLTWHSTLYSDLILNSEYRRRWWTPHPSQAGNEREFNYTMGLGWFMLDVPAGTFLGHGGAISGFRSTFLHLQKGDITAVVLCNGEHVTDLEGMAVGIIRELKLL